MAVQAALGSDIALAFDECTPFHVERDYTARSTERTHRWLARCLRWHADHGPAGQLLYGIVQGGVFEDLRRASAQAVLASRCDGVAIGGSLGADKAQMYEVVGFARRSSGARTSAASPPARDRRGRRSDPGGRARDRHLRLRHADPPGQPRHGAGARSREALAHRPREGARARDDAPLIEGCPCPACGGGLSRAYLSYLVRAGELTGARLLTMHNLAFIARLMGDLRGEILEGPRETVAARGAPARQP